MKISFILPTFAETESLGPLVDQLNEYLGEKIYEMIFVLSPKSPEETVNIVKRLRSQDEKIKLIVQASPEGLGNAVRDGLKAVTGTHVLMMDSDGEMDPKTALLMVRKVEETGCDMVVASRWVRGGGVQGYSKFKYVLNRGFQSLFRILYWTDVHDLTLGFKLIHLDKIRGVNWNSTFHEIATETTLRPIRMGLRVEEVPTVWVCRQWGKSNNPFRRNFRYVAKALEILRDPVLTQ